MPGVRSVGRAPDSDASLMTKKASDDYNATVLVDAAYVNSRISVEVAANALQTTAYVDAQDALRAHKTDVDAADATYIAAATLNVAGGVAGLDSSGALISGQLPTVPTDRVATSVSAVGAGIFLTSGLTYTVTSQNIREFRVATIDVADPGYPWVPVPFATIGGYPGGASDPGQGVANGNTGRLVCCPPPGDDTIYGAAVACSSYQRLSYAQLLPYGASNMTPISQPAVNGALTLNLYASCQTGASYTFSGTGLVYLVVCFPAM